MRHQSFLWQILLILQAFALSTTDGFVVGTNSRSSSSLQMSTWYEEAGYSPIAKRPIYNDEDMFEDIYMPMSRRQRPFQGIKSSPGALFAATTTTSASGQKRQKLKQAASWALKTFGRTKEPKQNFRIMT